MWSQRHRHLSIEAPRHHPHLEVIIPARLREQLQTTLNTTRSAVKHLPRLQRDICFTLCPCVKGWALSGVANRNAGERFLFAAKVGELEFVFTVQGNDETSYLSIASPYP